MGPDRLRFDFSFSRALTPIEINALETRVNSIGLSNQEVKVDIQAREYALACGAIAMFGEKYGEEVRVVSIGTFSKELCGGTHAKNSRDMFPFVILSESAISAGTRRIEAVAGIPAIEVLQAGWAGLQSVASLLNVKTLSASY